MAWNACSRWSSIALLACAALLVGTTAVIRGQDDAGKREYVRGGCDSCHGPEAHGAGQAPELAGLKRPYPEFVQIVREGIGEMPPHSKDDVSDEQLAAIYKWLTQLLPKP
jgi:mono/diheme cytochrome c family protein